MTTNGAHAVRNTPDHDTAGRHQQDWDDAPAGRGGAVDRGTDAHDTRVSVTTPPTRADQVRWGPVWAGLTVVVPVFLLGILLFLAVGVLDAGDSVTGGTAAVVTGLIALVAFFVGGLTAGATAMWRGANTGLLHGILVWALGIIAILALTLLGGGALLGSAGTIASQLVDPATLTGAVSGAGAPDVSSAELVDAGRSAASWGLVGLGLTVIASALGGLVGSKVWPRKKDLRSSTTTS